MKEKIQSWLVNVVGCALLVAIGAAGVWGWNLSKFQAAYQQGVLDSQRQNISSYCEITWLEANKEAVAKKLAEEAEPEEEE